MPKLRLRNHAPLSLAFILFVGLGGCSDNLDRFTNAERCVRACNQQHDRCYDAPDTRFESYGEPRHVIGMGAACDQTLKDCQKDCGRK
jgi:hypothetical protein